MPPELDLICTAHYLEALGMQAKASQISALLGGIDGDIASGSYKAEKGRLYLNESGSGFKTEESMGYTLNGGTMTWHDDNALLAALEDMGISSSLEWSKQ